MPAKSNTESFIKKAVEKYGNKYSYDKVLYKNSKEYVIITCKEHGDFNQIPNSHLSGYGCPKCVKNFKCDTTAFVEKAIKVHNNKFDYSNVNYVNSTTKVSIICKIHGVFNQTPRDHIAGYGCSKCGNSHNYSTEEYIELCSKKHNKKYEYTKTVYKKANSYVIVTCKTHGDFKQKGYLHLYGHGCPKCSPNSGSKKVKIIDDYFHNYEVLSEYKYNDCTYKRQLPFDRYIPNLNLLIEYDGEQHFQPIINWGGEEAYKLQVIKDGIKNQYCIDNNINLLRIKYDENIEEVLNKFMQMKLKNSVLIQIHGEIKLKKSLD